MHVTTTLATAMGTGAGAGRVSLTLTHAQPSEKKSDRIQARFRSGGTHMACRCRLLCTHRRIAFVLGGGCEFFCILVHFEKHIL
jgi:hypothetical protein